MKKIVCLLLSLLLISCSVQHCKIDPNASIQTKLDTKVDSKSTDYKVESKSIVDQIRDFRDNIQPGAQWRCSF